MVIITIRCCLNFIQQIVFFQIFSKNRKLKIAGEADLFEGSSRVAGILSANFMLVVMFNLYN